MATIKHSRTIALQATSPRIVAVPLPTNITADWTTNVTGTGKPADSATVNRIQTGTSFSGTPVDGDIWIDTNTSPAIVKTRIAGAWVSSANYTTNTAQLTDGAGLGNTALWAGVTGTGKPSNYADVTTTILSNSGTAIVMTASNLFKSSSGAGGVFIGAGGLLGKTTGGATTFSIDATSGAATFAGTLSAATGSFGAVTAGGAITVNTSGNISNGISYGGTGFFLGYSGGAYKFSVGNASSYLRWDGSSLSFTGNVPAGNITAGTIAGSGIQIMSSKPAAWLFYADNTAVDEVFTGKLSSCNIYATNESSSSKVGSTGAPAIYGISVSTQPSVTGYNPNSGGIGVAGYGAGASSSGGYFSNASGPAITSNGRTECTGTVRSTGVAAPSSGSGTELLYSGGVGYVQAYNRSGSTYLPMYVSGSSVIFNGPSGGMSATLDSSGFVSSGPFGCNGQSAQSAYTVNGASSDLASVVALCNQLRAALIGIGIAI